MNDPKAVQPSRPFQPSCERRSITDDQIRELRAKFVAEGFQGSFSVKMADRALAGDVSAVNALKMLLYGPWRSERSAE